MTAIPILPPKVKIYTLPLLHQDYIMNGGETWCIPFTLNQQTIVFNVISTNVVPDLSIRTSISIDNPIDRVIDYPDYRPYKSISAYNLPTKVSDIDSTCDFLLNSNQLYYFNIKNCRNYPNQFRIIIT